MRFVRWATSVAAIAFATATTSSASADDGPPWATGESDPDDLRISLVTMGPGDEVHQYFGHTGLEIRDERLGVEALYNFGAFGFDPSFLLKFLRGRLEFWVSVQSPAETYRFYASRDRDVRIVPLSLTPDEKRTLAREAATHALPEHRAYLYHHYLDNCATRIRDLIDRATGGELSRRLEGPDRFTYRDHTRRYAARDPIVDWLLVFAMNDSMEAPLQERDALFLPEELERAVVAFQRARDPASLPPRIVHRASAPRPVFDVPPRTWPYTLAFGLTSGLAFVFLGRRANGGRSRATSHALAACTTLYGLVVGSLGTTLAALALFTEHTVTYGNENLFFASPLAILLVPIGIGLVFGSSRARRWQRPVWTALLVSAGLGLALKILPAFDQENTLVWTLLAPITAGGFWAALRALPMREKLENFRAAPPVP